MNIKPLDNSFAARFYDGERALSQPARISLTGTGMQIELGSICLFWPYSDCRILNDASYAEPATLVRPSQPGPILSVEIPDFIPALGQYAPGLVSRPWWDIRLQGWASILRSAAGVLILGGLFYFMGLSLVADLAARWAPRSVESRIGASTVQLLTGVTRTCSSPTSGPLLARVEKRLFSTVDSEYSFKVLYIRLDMVNAFAAPGGTILVSDSLLRLTQSPEEFAGVLAHEIQHVLQRDSMRAIARQLGGGMLLAMMSVDPSSNPILLNQSASLMNLTFSRDAERQADAGAALLLEKAALPGEGLVLFLNRLLETEGATGGKPPVYLSTHPDTSERIVTLRRQIRKDAPVKPLLSPAEWATAQRVCAAE